MATQTDNTTTEVLRAGNICWDSPAGQRALEELRNPTPMTTIINKHEYDKTYAGRSSSSLMFQEDFWDCRRYVDTTKLRKKFRLKGKGRILHILVGRMGDAKFINRANKDVVYKSPVACDKTADGATLARWGGYAMNHPLGDVIVVLAD